MKKKAKQVMHANTTEELTKAVATAQSTLAELLVNRYSKQSKNVREGRELRKKIAVAKTMLRIKELTHE